MNKKILKKLRAKIPADMPAREIVEGKKVINPHRAYFRNLKKFYLQLSPEDKVKFLDQNNDSDSRIHR